EAVRGVARHRPVEVAGEEGEVRKVDVPVVVVVALDPLRATGLVEVGGQEGEVAQVDFSVDVAVAGERGADQYCRPVDALPGKRAAAGAKRLRGFGVADGQRRAARSHRAVDAVAVPRAAVPAALDLID